MTMPQRPVVLAWYGCDLASGQIIEELRSITVSQPLTGKLCASSTSLVSLALDGAPRGWEAATQQGRTMLVAVDTLTGKPIGAWLTLTRAGGSDPAVDLGLVSPEGYFDRRYTGTYTGADDQAAILTGTGAALMVSAPPFVFDAQATGTSQTYSVSDGDDRTVLSVWQEITDAGGPEWTVGCRWNSTNTGFVLPVLIRPRVGTITSTPDPVFDLPGCISQYTLTESYETGKGATRVTEYGTGEGVSRLRSDILTADDLIAAGYCLFEYRGTPADAATDPVQLTATARTDLAAMRTGSAVWAVTATASQAPRLGRDFGLGDSIGVQVRTSPRHPDGASTVARCWSWTLDPGADQISPILVEDDDT
ncbi:hypothetical protein [Streptomyces sp. 8L]|uniref:hypothetical protein n=1 Tax=Streptomyces sp. 8L TaxID=2877242 RepID=UPI001CD6E927|nr:hypothetical protein [Streptomyces sp. 8L]MCA1218707.1 hypothetical protein [Streptomyces sp. 8L]